MRRAALLTAIMSIILSFSVVPASCEDKIEELKPSLRIVEGYITMPEGTENILSEDILLSSGVSHDISPIQRENNMMYFSIAVPEDDICIVSSMVCNDGEYIPFLSAVVTPKDTRFTIDLKSTSVAAIWTFLPDSMTAANAGTRELALHIASASRCVEMLGERARKDWKTMLDQDDILDEAFVSLGTEIQLSVEGML